MNEEHYLKITNEELDEQELPNIPLIKGWKTSYKGVACIGLSHYLYFDMNSKSPRWIKGLLPVSTGNSNFQYIELTPLESQYQDILKIPFSIKLSNGSEIFLY